jgi:hypothetical protein
VGWERGVACASAIRHAIALRCFPYPRACCPVGSSIDPSAAESLDPHRPGPGPPGWSAGRRRGGDPMIGPYLLDYLLVVVPTSIIVRAAARRPLFPSMFESCVFLSVLASCFSSFIYQYFV